MKAPIAILVAVLLAIAGAASPTAAVSAPPEPTIPETQLEAATACDQSLTEGTATQAVLLVHGTGSTPTESWSWNYGIALRRAGYGVCTVTLPERALVDLSVSAEYVAYAVKTAYRVSERRIAIVGHSQGGLLSMWVTRFWPDVAQHTADVISLAGPLNGTALANTLCVLRSCAKVAWQQRRGAAFVSALNAAPLPPQVAHTSIGTTLDEIVFPQPAASRLPGGRTVMVQDICPARVVEHGSLLSDAVVYGLVLDAIQHDGPADPNRVDRALCGQLMLPGTDLAGAAGFLPTATSLLAGLLDVTRWVSAEPPVPAYARGN